MNRQDLEKQWLAHCAKNKEECERMAEKWDEKTVWVSYVPDLPTSLLEQNPAMANIDWAQLRINFPFNRTLLPVIEEWLVGEGWVVDSKSLDESEGYGISMTFRKDGVPFTLCTWLTDRLPGSVCKKVRIGTKQVDVGIYEYSCEGEKGG